MLLMIFTTLGLVFAGRSTGCLEGDCRRKKVHKKKDFKICQFPKTSLTLPIPKPLESNADDRAIYELPFG
jgi:hypothetical protein